MFCILQKYAMETIRLVQEQHVTCESQISHTIVLLKGNTWNKIR